MISTLDILTFFFIYKGHYTLIRDQHRLLNLQTGRNKNMYSKTNSEFNYCQRCLYNTSSAKKLLSHIRYCIAMNKQAHAKLPPPKSKLSFHSRGYKSQFMHSFTIYADYDVVQEQSIDLETHNVRSLDKPSQVGFCIVNKHSKNEYHYFAGRKVDQHLVDQLIKRVITNFDSIYNQFYQTRIYAVPEVPQSTIDSATQCSLCNKPFTQNDVKVLDHDHFTGNFRGIAHQLCNTKVTSALFIPKLFHNFSGYDSHLFIKALATHPAVAADEISVILLTHENYISVSVRFELGNRKYIDLRFLDSMRFKKSSLGDLTSSLATTKYLDQERTDTTQLSCKGVFPYECIDSCERYNEASLPSKDKFFSTLYYKAISDSDYQHAQLVWNHHKSKQLKNMLIFI